MSRIFVNTQNEIYKRVTQNAQNVQLGLGIPTELSPAEIDELGQKFNEIFFSSGDLLEKKRKIQIIFDSFTDPKFFGDGAVKPDKVEKYLTDLKLEAERVNQLTNTAGDVVLYSTALYWAGPLGVFALQGILSNLQAKREDDAAPWKMTRADFPNITSQAIAGNSNRRSIERLYDDRSGLKTFDVKTEEAIARLIRESLADALFCTTNAPNGLTPPEHPGPGDKDKLKNYFPFKEETSGADRLERTYVNGLLYLKSYIDLIDSI